MKIWHVCSLDPCEINGMVNVIPEHVKEQAKYEQILLINLSEKKIQLSSNIVSICVKNCNRNSFKKLILKYGIPDLIIIHGIFIPIIWKFIWQNIKGNYPYIIVPHGSMARLAQKKSHMKKMIVNNLLIYKLTRDADAVQFLCQNEKNAADLKYYNKFLICGNGISRKDKHITISNAKNIVFTMIGRMDIFHKGIDILLEACNINKELFKKKNVTINIYGTDENGSKNKIKKYIEMNYLDDIVSVFNGVYEQEKERILFENTTYFIMTSRFEGQPMAVLEAMSYGIPIVVTRGTGFYEEIQQFKCGFVAENDASEVAIAMKNAYEHIGEYDELINNTLKCVEMYYWENVGKKTIDIYRRYKYKA